MNANTQKQKIETFLGQDNIHMLWSVLITELNINSNNSSMMTNIETIFNTNINMFRNKTNLNAPLMMLNKQFLQQVITAIHKLFPNIQQETQFKKINIGENVSDPYKVEDIHASRQTDFDRQLKLKQTEFDNTVNFMKPAEIDFTEKIKDEKISHMDTLIAETMARRNLELDTTFASLPNPNANISLNINEEPTKKISPDNVKDLLQSNFKKTKYVNLDETGTNIIDLNNSPINKKVSWNSELTNDNAPLDLFSKLKMTVPTTNVDYNNNDIINEIKSLHQKYDEINNKLDKLLDKIGNVLL